jgi:hypothetical protein
MGVNDDATVTVYNIHVHTHHMHYVLAGERHVAKPDSYLKSRDIEQFAVDLAAAFPLGENLDFYYDASDEFLPHVYFGVEVTPRVVAAYTARDDDGPGGLDWRAVLAFLDEAARTRGDAVKTVIGTSFLFRLPRPGQEGYGIVAELPAELARLFRLARPEG